VKIDRSFVSALDTDARREAVVQAVLRMAEALGLAVIAEGVETAGQRQRLRELGCHYAQGWLFGRSTPAGAFEVFLRERRRGLGAIEALPAQPTQLTQLAETRREGCDVVTADETVGLQT
jgi:predicted signal transduction protein with EAL and GGDEF domain